MVDNIKQLVESLFDDETIDQLSATDDTVSTMHNKIISDNFYAVQLPKILGKKSEKTYKLLFTLPDNSYQVKDDDELCKIVIHLISKYNNEKTINFNWLDVSKINSLMSVFSPLMQNKLSDYNGTILIDKWNTSNIKYFNNCFKGFHGKFDVSNWDVSSGINFFSMFSDMHMLTCDLNKWNLRSALTVQDMFRDTNIDFNLITDWDVSNISNFSGMFYNNNLYLFKYNGSLSNWNVWNGTNFSNMFTKKALTAESGVNKWKINISKIKDSVKDKPYITWKDALDDYILANCQLIENEAEH